MSHASQSPRSIFIVDDHALVRTMLSIYVERQKDLAICGPAATGEEALRELLRRDCDLALIDVAMPGMSGIELAQHLQKQRPMLKCLILSGHAEQVYVQGALAAGAKGYVMKDDPEVIFRAIRQVLRGEVYLSEAIKAYWHA